MQVLSVVPKASPPAMIAMLLALIDPSKTNPRKLFDAESHKGMTESVKQHGVLQPVLVRPVADRFELVAGERRFRAAMAAGLTEIPAISRELSDTAVLEIQVIENLQREDLHPVEEAEGYQRLLDDHAYTIAMIADKVGRSPTYVNARLKLCSLTKANRKLFFAGKLNASTALLLARIPVPELQDKAGQEISEGQYRGGEPMSVGQAVDHVHRTYMLELKRAPFPVGDLTLVPGAGTCAACPKRTGNQKEMFSDVRNGDTCTDPVCFGAKRDAHAKNLRTAAELNGQKVFTGAAAKKVLPYDSGEAADGWAKLDSNCHQDAKSRTYRAILGKAAPTPALVQLDSGVMVEVVRVSEIADVLKAKGITARTTSNPREKALEVAAARETAVRTEIFAAVRANYPAKLDSDSLRAVVGCWLNHAGSDAQRLLCKVREWKYGDYQDREKLVANLAGLDDKALYSVLLDLTLIGETRCHSYSTSKPTRLMAAAERFKVDAAAIRASVTKVAADKIKAKAKAKVDAVKAKTAKVVAKDKAKIAVKKATARAASKSKAVGAAVVKAKAKKAVKVVARAAAAS